MYFLFQNEVGSIIYPSCASEYIKPAIMRQRLEKSRAYIMRMRLIPRVRIAFIMNTEGLPSEANASSPKDLNKFQ